MIDMIKLIEICLEDWTAHYPTGCIIHFYDDVVNSFCDTVDEFKSFLDEYRTEIAKSHPRVVFKINLDDIDTSNVMQVVYDIKKHIEKIERG